MSLFFIPATLLPVSRTRSAAVFEAHRKRSFERRMVIVHLVLAVAALIVVARLIELQVIKGKDFLDLAQARLFGGVKLPARGGKVLSQNAPPEKKSILGARISRKYFA